MDTSERRSVVLVADSEIALLREVSSTLEKAGFAVLTAGNRAAAVAACQRLEPIDLAILDLAMPGGAPEMMEELRRAQPGMRVLLTSSRDESEVPSELQHPSGIYRGHLRKPFRRAHLLGRVLNVTDTPLTLTA